VAGKKAMLRENFPGHISRLPERLEESERFRSLPSGTIVPHSRRIRQTGKIHTLLDTPDAELTPLLQPVTL